PACPRPITMRTKEATMFQLTPEQWREIHQAGDPVRVADPETKQEYVLLRAEIYARLKELLYDDSPWTAEETLQLLAESGKQAGWDAPEMDLYDHYDENRRKLCP